MNFYSAIYENYDHIFPLQKAQVDYVQQEIPIPHGKLLDVGCATGSLAIALSNFNYEVTAIDLDEKMIKLAIQKSEKNARRLHFKYGNMLYLESIVPPSTLDGVVCFGNTLVHLDSLKEIAAFIQAAVTVLMPGGKLLIQILNYEYILQEQLSTLPLIDNDSVRFERSYNFLSNGKIAFLTRLTIKSTQQITDNRIELLPITKSELSELLAQAGFIDMQYFGSFSKTLLTNTSLPLVVSARKAG